jgi:hypothetical protein
MLTRKKLKKIKTKLINIDELENTKNMRKTLPAVIEYLKVTLKKNTIKFLGIKPTKPCVDISVC